MKTLMVTALMTIATLSTHAQAHEYEIGKLTIDHPYARSTPPSSPVAGGFMTITNHGDDADRLIGGNSTFSDTVEVHEMIMVDGIMKMGQVEGGLEIPAGETVTLKPGGYHIMFIGLQEQLKPDERRKGLLKFENAGDIEVEYLVKDITKMMDHTDKGDKKEMEAMDHMDHSKMDHANHDDHASHQKKDTETTD